MSTKGVDPSRHCDRACVLRFFPCYLPTACLRILRAQYNHFFTFQTPSVNQFCCWFTAPICFLKIHPPNMFTWTPNNTEPQSGEGVFLRKFYSISQPSWHHWSSWNGLHSKFGDTFTVLGSRTRHLATSGSCLVARVYAILEWPTANCPVPLFDALRWSCNGFHPKQLGRLSVLGLG